jgi:WD40 repeat protein
VAFSRDGRFVLTGSWDSTARLWDAATGQQGHSFDEALASVEPVAFFNPGRFVLTAGNDKAVRVRNASTRPQI